MDFILAPDVFVNASVALGSPPEQVVRRVFSTRKDGHKSSEWILARVRQMLTALPDFKDEAIESQLGLIRSLVQVVKVPDDHGPGDWQPALSQQQHRFPFGSSSPPRL